MHSPEHLEKSIAAMLHSGQSFALATVVRIEGSSYRKPGAMMAIPAQGQPLGILSGGCLEAEIIERAAVLLMSGGCQLLHFDLTSDDEYLLGYGKGCAGRVWVLLEAITRDYPHRAALMAQMSQTQAVTVGLVYEAEPSSGISVGSRVLWPIDKNANIPPHGDLAVRALFAEPSGSAATPTLPRIGQSRHLGGLCSWVMFRYTPSPELLLIGAGADAVPLVGLALQLGWSVRIADHRPARLTGSEFASAAMRHHVDREGGWELPAGSHTHVVIMSHNFLVDAEALAWAAAQGELPYIGLLGPRRRRDKLLQYLASQGRDIAGAVLPRLHSPVGLALGGESEYAISLAIVAEIHQEWHRRALSTPEA